MDLDADGWPRLTVDVGLRPPDDVDVGRSHVWRIALAAANASTIEYKGEAGSGGYDVCCGFVHGSRCRLRPRDDVVSMLEGGASADGAATNVDGGGDGGEGSTSEGSHNSSTAAIDVLGRVLREEPWYEQRSIHYAQHDCPLPRGHFEASVSKPLHLKAAGRWAAVLLLTEGKPAGGEPPPTACVAIHLTVTFPTRPPRTPPPAASSTGSTAPRWEQVSSGKWCSDGADLLEGALDGYTDCDERTGLCSMSRKCKERCSKRSACRYYTSWASGYCQLSSRCNQEAPATDPASRTFRKM